VDTIMAVLGGEVNRCYGIERGGLIVSVAFKRRV
jgi:hypothetical protein